MAQLKISRIMAAQAEQAGIRIAIGAGGTRPVQVFEFYRADLDVFIGRAWTASEASAFLRGWLAARGIVAGEDPRGPEELTQLQRDGVPDPYASAIHSAARTIAAVKAAAAANGFDVREDGR
jgi:hypothetical protein